MSDPNCHLPCEFPAHTRRVYCLKGRNVLLTLAFTLLVGCAGPIQPNYVSPETGSMANISFWHTKDQELLGVYIYVDETARACRRLYFAGNVYARSSKTFIIPATSPQTFLFRYSTVSGRYFITCDSNQVFLPRANRTYQFEIESSGLEKCSWQLYEYNEYGHRTPYPFSTDNGQPGTKAIVVTASGSSMPLPYSRVGWPSGLGRCEEN